MIRALLNRLAYLGGRSGTASVEFAITAPLLAALLTGIADLGLLANNTAVVDAAVRAAGQYARASPLDSDGVSPDPNIAAIIRAYSTLTSSATVTYAPPSNTSQTYPFCECDDGSSVNCSTGTCATGGKHTYVTVTATVNYTPIIPWSAMGLPSQITSWVVQRVS
jgi:Flp pilus assembly protein TadG